MRRALLKGLAILLPLAVAAIWGRASSGFPPSSRERAGVIMDIIRDRAVTHVFGSGHTLRPGYAHAQDRLWQMEFQRRVGHARLSEVFGAQTVGTDRFLRTLGTGRAARSAWDALPADAKDAVNRYVAGVNAFISTHHGRQLPLEFTLLRFEPEPWSGPDVLVWVKMMAWDLSKNYSIELLRRDLILAVGADRTADLLPPYPAGGLTIRAPARCRG
jgi:penicillin amidase